MTVPRRGVPSSRIALSVAAFGVLLPGVLLPGVLLPAEAVACAACGCGDPTLTSMGTEAPFAGRLRASLSLRGWSRDFGVPHVDAERVQEARLDASLAWAPLDWLFLSAMAPLQARRLEDVSLARESALGLGDIEISARAFVFRDHPFAAHHLISLLGGVKLPVGPLQRDASGQPLSLDAQLGTGSWDVLGGVGYSGFYSNTWSVYASATGYWTGRGFEDFRAGRQLRVTLAAQYQPMPSWAVRLAADGRWATAADQAGIPDHSDEGFVGYASPDLIFSPRMDLLLQLGVRIPVARRLAGPGSEGPIVLLSVVYDL